MYNYPNPLTVKETFAMARKELVRDGISVKGPCPIQSPHTQFVLEKSHLKLYKYSLCLKPGHLVWRMMEGETLL